MCVWGEWGGGGLTTQLSERLRETEGFSSLVICRSLVMPAGRGGGEKCVGVEGGWGVGGDLQGGVGVKSVWGWRGVGGWGGRLTTQLSERLRERRDSLLW